MSILHDKLIANGEKNRINIIDISKEALGDDLYSMLSETKWFRRWTELNVDQQEFSDLGEKLLNFDNLNSFCHNLGELDWRTRLRGCEDILVEQDTTFKNDCSYVYTFILNMMNLKAIPTPDQFWNFWQIVNCEAMTHNLDANWQENTTIILWLERHTPEIRVINQRLFNNLTLFAKDTEEVRNYWALMDKARDSILKAAEYRCKKAYCAILRELYLLSYFTFGAPEEEGLPSFPALTVWWHPVIDMVCKADAVVINEENKVIALAVYLDTRKSQDWARKKAKGIPKAFADEMNIILSAPIKLDKKAMDKNEIVLPEAQSMMYFRMMLGGNPVALSDHGVYHQENNWSS